MKKLLMAASGEDAMLDEVETETTKILLVLLRACLCNVQRRSEKLQRCRKPHLEKMAFLTSQRAFSLSWKK
jgi:hypothetical protein